MTLFLDGPGASVFLVGLPMYPEDGSVDAPCAVLVGDDTYYEVPAEYRAFLEVVSHPLPVSQLASWLATEGGSGDTVEQLVEAGKLRKVEPGPGSFVLRHFEGLVLRPASQRLERPDDEAEVDGVTFVGWSARPDLALPVSTTLAAAMWNRLEDEDFVSTVVRLADAAGSDLDDFAHEALEWLPGLLASGYGYLGPVASV